MADMDYDREISPQGERGRRGRREEGKQEGATRGPQDECGPSGFGHQR